jgi:hypothetical protein
MDTFILLLLVFGFAIILLMGCTCNSPKENFNEEKTLPVQRNGDFPLPSNEWLSEMFPSMKLERQYRECIAQNRKNKNESYETMERCYIQAMRGGHLDDHCSRMCEDKPEGAQKLDCMGGCYGDRRRADRYSGIDMCVCPNGSTGTGLMDRSTGKPYCHCPIHRPLDDRRPAFDIGVMHE